ncbi:helix-turn-helix domain-containing protein [Pelagibacterium sp. H642]|uniref:helix-turn-helix domain-containing protein n=1 Tax=Pelagibacterium sp. H642 TaxID=1881069 RepID=UPI00281698F0|nr:helix-turn-helix domain-containing protein [Pelagibacterium sp. H642]WMT90425.1 helix-turn-helix domain-containing protein [Pelagibacterium sp. H642]
MIPVAPYVIRFTPGEDDQVAARRIMKALIAAETRRPETSALPGHVTTTLPPTLNKLLQNVCAAVADGDGVSVIVLGDRELLPVRDIAEVLGYGPSQITRLLKSGTLRKHKYNAGRKRLVPASAIAERLQAAPRQRKHPADRSRK